MRTIKSRLAVTGALLAVLALAACSTVIDGDPSCPGCGSYTEPEGPTPSPTAEAPTAAPAPTPVEPAPGPTGPAPSGENLPADAQGLVYIETKSGKTRCQLSSATVGCESAFDNAPEINGYPANGVSVNSAGTLEWIQGNLGAIPTVALDYATYQAVGWTIVADANGTRFTNNGTGHGMFVATQGVESF
ncbi:hypothetical protein [Mycolicibacterium brumae]|uniref:hypothetical protein n=1 Tax=Mycolicibacterium brumae TaxID=85968 RepID=UPI000B2E794D|nr:hypothetical protein [Mycolicibacterium brumae]MCV7192632.1 hypothetical protein [Mycolicibacterium brumae]RWA18376.1 hypothetical protein MBRU_03955 [Mycolicibacterium brumae DSM 44177]UWW10402.1 hypothetical protein L2Z93_003531 [Mycolicibacterium brumae]